MDDDIVMHLARVQMKWDSRTGTLTTITLVAALEPHERRYLVDRVGEAVIIAPTHAQPREQLPLDFTTATRGANQ